MNEEKHKREAYRVARNRDKKGHVVKVNLREYTMCVTPFSAGSRLNMLTLVAVEDNKTEVTMIHYPHGWNKGGVQKVDICPAITTSSWEDNHMIMEDNEYMCVAVRTRSEGEWGESEHFENLEVRSTEYTNSLTTVAKDNYIACLRKVRTEEERERRHKYGDAGARFSSRAYEPRQDGITNTISTITKDNYIMTKFRIRKLTPTECFRLMGVRDADIRKIRSAEFKKGEVTPVNYGEHGDLTDKDLKKEAKLERISESQQYKMAGNSIVVDVLDHIFENMFFPQQPKEEDDSDLLFKFSDYEG